MRTQTVAVSRPAPAGRDGSRFNVFRRLDAPELRCAVPEDRAVPRFIHADGWAFVGRLDGDAPPPHGFDPRAAHVSARWNGFYLFEMWAREASG